MIFQPVIFKAKYILRLWVYHFLLLILIWLYWLKKKFFFFFGREVRHCRPYKDLQNLVDNPSKKLEFRATFVSLLALCVLSPFSCSRLQVNKLAVLPAPSPLHIFLASLPCLLLRFIKNHLVRMSFSFCNTVHHPPFSFLPFKDWYIKGNHIWLYKIPVPLCIAPVQEVPKLQCNELPKSLCY